MGNFKEIENANLFLSPKSKIVSGIWYNLDIHIIREQSRIRPPIPSVANKSCLRQHFYLFKHMFDEFLCLLFKKVPKVPCQGGDKLKNEYVFDGFHDIYKQVIKEVTTSQPQALFGKTNIQEVMFFMRIMFFMKVIKKHTKGPSSVKSKEIYSQIPQFDIVRNVFQVLSKDLFLNICFQVLSEGSFSELC